MTSFLLWKRIREWFYSNVVAIEDAKSPRWESTCMRFIQCVLRRSRWRKSRSKAVKKSCTSERFWMELMSASFSESSEAQSARQSPSCLREVGKFCVLSSTSYGVGPLTYDGNTPERVVSVSIKSTWAVGHWWAATWETLVKCQQNPQIPTWCTLEAVSLLRFPPSYCSFSWILVSCTVSGKP